MDTAHKADMGVRETRHPGSERQENGNGEKELISGESTPSDDSLQGLSAEELQSRTAYYNRASERSLSHIEAKLIYQRHRRETLQQDAEACNPLARTRTFSSNFEGDLGGLSRNTSRASRGSGLGYKALPNIDPYSQSVDAHSPDLNGPNTYRTLFDGGRQEDPFAAVDGGDSMHSASAFDLGTQASGKARDGLDITPELNAIFVNIKRVLDIRRKYIRLSLQGPKDNPKDSPDWGIYPSPPKPVWDDVKNRPIGVESGANSLSNSKLLPSEQDEALGPLFSSSSVTGDNLQQAMPSPTAKKRKMGHDIGGDFEMADLLPLPGAERETAFRLDQSSIYQVYKSAEAETPMLQVPTLREFYMDLDEVQEVASDGPTKSFAFRELEILEGRFTLHTLENGYQETADSKKAPHRDFYNVRKVDTHVHHSACMNQKHLLRFIKSKMKKSPEETVMFRDGKHLTLREVFESINLTAYDLSIDTLDMHAHTDSFHRFDKFNLKYNPIGESRLREIFLKTDNYIQGRYLAEITKEVIADLESSKYQMVEWRISIYGRAIDEWDKLAAWVVDNKLISHNVRWLIQIPRLYSAYKAAGRMSNFEHVIVNIFQPLYEVTQNPQSHPKLHVFLHRVIGFDSVDDESKVEKRLYRKFPSAKEWDTKQNPPYTYWIYYLFANIVPLNAWRKQRGFTTFLLRPHCGEAGDHDHLAAAAICCHSISHGLLLRKVPILQYIFYLEQIGIAMSPLSNNALFLAYERNPFLQYFRRGLNVSLSTDDPLQFAFTKEPLIEEYSVAAQIYKLGAVDMCELAQNSVIQSGFEHQLKQRWLGSTYHLPGVEGNNVDKSNVPRIRARFRQETLEMEHALYDGSFSNYVVKLIVVLQDPKIRRATSFGTKHVYYSSTSFCAKLSFPWPSVPYCLNADKPLHHKPPRRLQPYQSAPELPDKCRSLSLSPSAISNSACPNIILSHRRERLAAGCIPGTQDIPWYRT